MRIAFALPRREEYGFGMYLRLLLQGLAAIDTRNEYILFAVDDAAEPLTDLPKNAKIVSLPAQWPNFRWRKNILRPACREHKVDVLHFHNNTIGPTEGIPTVVTLHHITYAYPPEEKSVSWFERRYIRKLFATIARDAGAIITDSRHSAADIDRLLQPRTPATIVPLAADPFFRPAPKTEIDAVRNELRITRPYFFFSGSLGIRKNVPGMIRAFAEFNRDGAYEFLLAGSSPHAFGYRAAPLPESEHTRFIGFRSREELRALYSGAEALLYVTHYEGFGMPILEAFACECPVITSTQASCPEVAGNAALLANPQDSASLVRALSSLNRKDLIERGKKRVAQFSWEETARKTLAVYQNFSS